MNMNSNRNGNINDSACGCRPSCSMDFGGRPLAIDIDRATKNNPNYRTALWTGEHLQVTLMCIPVGGEIGLEVHCDTDQFLRIECGRGLVMMGPCRQRLPYCKKVDSNCAVMVPAGTWHNLVNTGDTPLKVYSIYAPPHHPFGTVERTKEEAEHAEKS